MLYERRLDPDPVCLLKDVLQLVDECKKNQAWVVMGSMSPEPAEGKGMSEVPDLFQMVFHDMFMIF